MKREILAITLVIMFLVPVVNAQTGLNSINVSIIPQQNETIEIISDAEDVLYMNLTINDDMQVIVQVFRGVSTLPIDEVYNGGGTGHFEVNITLPGGMVTVYLYNPSLEQVIYVHGVWGINYEPEPEPTTTTTPTDTTTDTWTGTDPPPTRPVDYWDVFMGVMFTWVLPALAALLILFLIWNFCVKTDNFDYLALINREELMRQREEEDEE